MKKLFVLLVVVVVSLTFTACKGYTPFSCPLTKWSDGALELYVNEQGTGYLLFETAEETLIFDAEFVYGNKLCIYKHRVSAEQPVELVWEYFPLGINNQNKCTFGTANFKNEAYSDIFSDKLVFIKQCEITSDDIEYDFYEVERDKQGNIIQPR